MLNLYLNVPISVTDDKWQTQYKYKCQVYQSKLGYLLQYGLVPLLTSGISHLFHEELRGEDVQNVTISSHNRCICFLKQSFML